MKLTDEEVQACIRRAEEEYDEIKDRVHELFVENEKLKKQLKYKNEIIEEQEYKIEHLEDKIKDIEKDIADNFKRIPISQQVRC